MKFRLSVLFIFLGGLTFSSLPYVQASSPFTEDASGSSISTLFTIAEFSSGDLTLINFDDVNVPCGLNQTTALREAYAALGVHFLGEGNDGGGVANECGNMGIFGYSPPNFLAFNTGTNYLDGGVPQPPQYIYFDSPVDHVEIKAAGPYGGRVAFLAYDSSSNLLKKVEIPLKPAMQLLSMDRKGISFVVIDSGSPVFALDDFGWSVRTRE